MENIVIWNVDTQTDIMDADGTVFPLIPNVNVIRANLALIFQSALKNNIWILGSAEAHTEDCREFVANGGNFPRHCVIDTPGAGNIPETLLPGGVGVVKWNKQYLRTELKHLFQNKQVILTKNHKDVFTNPHIEKLLREIPPGTRIFVTGVVLEQCVDSAVLGLVEAGKRYGFTVSVVTDAVKELSAEARERTLEKFKAMGVTLVTTGEFVRLIEARAKAISPDIPTRGIGKGLMGKPAQRTGRLRG